MEEEVIDFIKRYDDFIDTSPDYVRDIAERFYELGMRDAEKMCEQRKCAEKKCVIIYVPYPVDSKEMKHKFFGEMPENKRQ